MVVRADIYFILHFADIFFSKSVCISVGGGGGGYQVSRTYCQVSSLIESSSKLLVTRTGIKAQTSSISGLWFPWPIYIFFEMRFDLDTLDSGERSLPFGLLVYVV